ncbi:MAG: TonB-dependent receptor [Pyrinomonadaceae bacterium]|nr:TonB-dependent receptor [Pyrinomonadaceae bacterium]
MKKLTFVIIAILLSVGLVFSQTSGRLSGTVSSPDGGLLPGATVIAKDTSTGKSQTVKTNENGEFLFPILDFGTYTLTISAQGFKTFVATDVKVDVARTSTLPVTLEVGQVQESVTVTAGTDVVSSNTTQISNTVSTKQILSLPLVTRDPLGLVTLQAGTASNPSQNTSINGMRTTMTNITRDGINIQDAFIRTNATDFAPGRPSVDDTSEFTLIAGNTEADQGYGGAQIKLVTPRGTKDFSGALFAYNRNSHFGANSFFNNRAGRYTATDTEVLAGRQQVGNLKSPRTFRNRNQFGGKIGGPIPFIPHFGEGGPTFDKDKGFFFFSYEGIKDPVSTASNITRTILTPSALGGAFKYTRGAQGAAINTTVGGASVTCPEWTGGTAPTCTISNILQFANGVGLAGIPTTVDPIIQNRVLSKLATASNFTGGDGLNTAGYRLTNRKSNQERNQYAIRVDVNATERDSFKGIYSWNRESNLRPDADTTTFSEIPNVIQYSTNQQFTFGYVRTIAPNIVNEFVGGFFNSDVPFDKTDASPSYLLSIPLVTFPENTFLSQGRKTRNRTFSDNLDWVKGSHSLRFGGEMQYYQVDSYNDAGIVPTYSIGTGSATPQFTTANFTSYGGIGTTNLGTANGLMSLLGGIVNGASQTFNIADVNSGFAATRLFQPFRYENHQAYAMDRWQLRSNLTVTAGLRYELYPALRIANGVALEPVLTGNDPVATILTPTGNYQQVGGNAGSKNYAYYKTDKNNFAPSVGLAYNTGFDSGIWKWIIGGEGKATFRGGYSQIYANDSIVTSIRNANANNSGLGSTGVSALNTAGTSANLNLRLSSGAAPVITAPTIPTLPKSYLSNNIAPYATGSPATISIIDPNIKTSMVEQYSFGYQREVLGNTAIEIRYVGTRSNNLTRSVDYNQVDIRSNGFLTDFERARANLALTGTTAFCNPATVAGCQALTIFQNGSAAGANQVGGATPGAGRLTIGTGGLSATTFNNALAGGTPADLAVSFINGGFNNHPTAAAPNNVPYLKLLPNPGTAVANWFGNDGWYNYNSVQMEVRRRFDKGLYLQANYTFSKNLTNAIGTSQTLIEPYLDNLNKQWDVSRADYDQTHTFNLNAIYDLPFGKGRYFLNQGGIVNQILGGWRMGGLLQMGSGAPITFVYTGGTLNRNGRSGRQTPFTNLTNDQIKDLVGYFEANGNIYYINPSVINPTTGRASEGYSVNGPTSFSGEAFFAVNPGQTGNMSRSVFNGPSTFVLNMSLLKTFSITERTNLELRAEAFNVLNHPYFTPASQFPSITSTTFGQLTGTNTPRVMQFAARFNF